MPIITAIIPTFRRPQLLKRAIASVLKQTYPHLQVCVYDNSSGDETEEVVRQAILSDSRVKYHCHPYNIGMMANYQYAISQVSTPYFSLLSDDDFLLPWFYETALKSFKHYPEIAFCACGVNAVDENNRIISEPLGAWPREGSYSPSEGLSQMIDKPILPVGILFQHQLVKDIHLDLSDEMQMKWDTDYLLKIIERHSFFVNQKACAVFLSHQDGFSSGRHRETLISADKFTRHVAIRDKMRQRISLSPWLTQQMKKSVEVDFQKSIKKDFHSYFSHYLSQGLISEFKITFCLYIKRYGGCSFFTALFFLLIKLFKRLSRKALELRRSSKTTSKC